MVAASELYVVIRTTLRTQVRPAIEFASGKEGLRPRMAMLVSWYCSLRVQVFLEIVHWLFPNFASAAGLSGGRGEMGMATPPCRSFPAQYIRTLSLCSLYSGSPLGSRPQPRGVTETSLPRKDTREGLLTVPFNFPAFTCCRVAFNVSLPSVQQVCGGFGGHGSRARWRFNATLRAGSPWRLLRQAHHAGRAWYDG